MTVFGLTGGTGTGKTTALNAIRDLGGLVIDCDEVYHGLTQTSAEMLSGIEARFPGTVVGGVLQRKTLGAIVFSDDAALSDLNAITHGFVCRKVERLLAEHEACGGTLAAIDAVALIESGLGRLCDCTVAVTAPEEARAARIMARDSIDHEYALMRIRAQKSDEWFRENCDHVLFNDYRTAEEFESYCRGFFTEKVRKYK
ncbi:MAG: dephospho-CoA kinase [Oscillospiraceae bacterium]|nr:dephospho-CoA kinase [Oscillospiraceae bacterium]